VSRPGLAIRAHQWQHSMQEQ